MMPSDSRDISAAREFRSLDVYVAECIVSNQLRRGQGIPGSPIRIVQQVFTKDGELLGELDPAPGCKHLMNAHLNTYIENCKQYKSTQNPCIEGFREYILNLPE